MEDELLQNGLDALPAGIGRSQRAPRQVVGILLHVRVAVSSVIADGQGMRVEVVLPPDALVGVKAPADDLFPGVGRGRQAVAARGIEVRKLRRAVGPHTVNRCGGVIAAPRTVALAMALEVVGETRAGKHRAFARLDLGKIPAAVEHARQAHAPPLHVPLREVEVLEVGASRKHVAHVIGGGGVPVTDGRLVLKRDAILKHGREVLNVAGRPPCQRRKVAQARGALEHGAEVGGGDRRPAVKLVEAALVRESANTLEDTGKISDRTGVPVPHASKGIKHGVTSEQVAKVRGAHDVHLGAIEGREIVVSRKPARRGREHDSSPAAHGSNIREPNDVNPGKVIGRHGHGLLGTSVCTQDQLARCVLVEPPSVAIGRKATAAEVGVPHVGELRGEIAAGGAGRIAGCEPRGAVEPAEVLKLPHAVRGPAARERVGEALVYD